MNAISITNLKKVYADGTEALKGINLDVDAGDFFALLGANGAGKTTIIGILTGLVIKTEGQAQILGLDVDKNGPVARRLIGVVPQEFNFNMFERVEDIVINQAGYFGIERKVAIKECERLLKKLEIWNKRDVPSRSLSGGMKRRLMIARALVNRPKLLILDEPTAGVDVELRHGMWEFLKELNREGTTILLTTHYLEEVEQMCRRAAIIKNGEIIKNDTVRSLLKLIDEETYIVQVDDVKKIKDLNIAHLKIVDDHTFEVELKKGDKLNDLILKMSQAGAAVTDIRPKGNRLEKLFLKILQQ